jgi:hypothetical protein
MNNYYIYIYLDPRESGRYVYENFSFLYKPFYIGKGKDRRLFDKRSRSKIFKNKINKIKKLGLEPIVFKLYENLNEEQSFKLEMKLIKEIGRKNINCGTLINLTDGGEGGSGLVISNELKEFRSKKYRKIFSDIQKEFEKRNYILLTTKEEYKNCYTKLKYICPKGHKNNTTWNDFQQKHGCNNCYRKNNIGENHPNHKLIKENIIKIWEHLNERIFSYRKIGKLFGVSATTISMIKNKKIWKDIGDIYENII